MTHKVYFNLIPSIPKKVFSWKTMMYESTYTLKVCTTYLHYVLRRKTIHVHELIACRCWISKRCHINCQKSSCKLFMFLRSAFLRSLCQLRCISNAPFGFWESIDKPSLQQNDKVFDCDIYANILWHLQSHSEFVKNSYWTKWQWTGVHF